MAEEFITDIIAADEGAGTDGADASDTPDEPTVDTPNPAANTNNSSSTPEEPMAKQPDGDSDLGSVDVAPAAVPEVEELASQLGWNKDHKGAETVDAATYILRSKDIQKTMKDHNKDLKNQLSGVQGSIDALKEHNERVYKAEVRKLEGDLADLRAEKKAAVELADVDKVEELDQRIEDVQKDINEPMPTDKPSDNPVFNEWVADNDWYLTDDDMAAYADAVAEQYAAAPQERVFALVRQKVAEVFPEKFETHANATPVVDPHAAKVVGPPSPVEAARRGGAANSFTKADLSADQTAIMNQFVKGGIMTEDQYVADIAKMQGAE